MRKPTIC